MMTKKKNIKKVKKTSNKKVVKKAPKKPTASKPKLVGKAGIRPFGDRVLIRPFTEEEVSGTNSNHFGIVLPESVTKEKSAQGKVVAVGEGRLVEGKRVALEVKVGDVIVFSKYGYDEVEYKGEEFYLIKEENILAVIN